MKTIIKIVKSTHQAIVENIPDIQTIWGDNRNTFVFPFDEHLLDNLNNHRINPQKLIFNSKNSEYLEQLFAAFTNIKILSLDIQAFIIRYHFYVRSTNASPNFDIVNVLPRTLETLELKADLPINFNELFKLLPRLPQTLKLLNIDLDFFQEFEKEKFYNYLEAASLSPIKINVRRCKVTDSISFIPCEQYTILAANHGEHVKQLIDIKANNLLDTVKNHIKSKNRTPLEYDGSFLSLIKEQLIKNNNSLSLLTLGMLSHGYYRVDENSNETSAKASLEKKSLVMNAIDFYIQADKKTKTDQQPESQEITDFCQFALWELKTIYSDDPEISKKLEPYKLSPQAWLPSYSLLFFKQDDEKNTTDKINLEDEPPELK